MKKYSLLLFALIIASCLALLTAAEEWNLSEITEVYRNTFDNADSLKAFSEYGGDWTVIDGRLHLHGGTNNHAFILFTGDEALTSMTDYVLDVDMYDTRTQAGVIVRSDLDYVTAQSNGFAGYFAFVSFDGKKGAIGSANKVGGWAGNLEVSEEITTPDADLHLRVIVRGNALRYIVSDLKSGKELWSHTETNSMWAEGTFGFRMSNMLYDGLSNLHTTSFDNLVISAFPKEEENPVKAPDRDIWWWLGAMDARENILAAEKWELESILLLIANMLGADVNVDDTGEKLHIALPLHGLFTAKSGPETRFSK